MHNAMYTCMLDWDSHQACMFCVTCAVLLTMLVQAQFDCSGVISLLICKRSNVQCLHLAAGLPPEDQGLLPSICSERDASLKIVQFGIVSVLGMCDVIGIQAQQCICNVVSGCTELLEHTSAQVVQKHRPNVETQFWCPQAFLSLDYQCRDGISELTQTF